MNARSTAEIKPFVPLRLVSRLARLAGRAGAVPLPATLLFADISGFTALAEQLSGEGPEGVERLSRILNDFFGRIITLVDASGGEVVAFAGDGLIALWPTDDETAEAATRAACQAASCAIAIRDQLHDFPADGQKPLQLRVGLGAGLALAARLGGHHDRWEAVVAGPPIAEAVAALARAQSGEVIAGPAVWRHVAATVPGEAPADDAMHVRLVGAPTEAAAVVAAVSAAQPSESTADARSPPFLDLAAYLPRALRDRSGATTWLAELRAVSVVFVQLPDFAQLFSDVTELQRAVLSVQETVARLDGSLDKVLFDDKGATVLAAFGLPGRSHEDDAIRAVQCSLAIERRLTEAGFASAVGVATGRVFCGPIGAPTRKQYTMIGPTVNLAARLETSSRAGEILIHETTFERIVDKLDVRPIKNHPILVKGKAQPIQTFLIPSEQSHASVP